MSIRLLLLLAGACVLPAFADMAGAESRVAVPVEGERFTAELASVSADGTLTLLAADETRQLPAGELVIWGAARDASTGTQILLSDGGLLVADVLGMAETSLSVDSRTFGELALPLDRVAGVVFRPPADPQSRDRLLDRLRMTEPATDRLLLENGDQLPCTLVSIDGDKVRCSTAAGETDVGVEKTIAVAFNPELIRPASRFATGFVVGLRDGSHVFAGEVLFTGDSLRLTLGDGRVWQAAEGTDVREVIILLRPLGAGVTYLSELPVAGYRHVPFFTVEWPYRLDRNVTDTRLRVAGDVYDKGVGMHSSSRLTFRLDQPYRLFNADLAIDEQTGGRGSVVFRVFSGREQIYESAIVRGGDPPLAMSVDVTGAELLSLIVDYADRGDEMDRANWLHARLVE